ncbi:hypothetical protein MASR2M117_09760 [Paludibacter sp.]
MNQLKSILFDKLKDVNAFWSFNAKSINNIPDEILIEKTLIHLDMDDINLLFKMYSSYTIKKVWRNRLVIQGDYYRSLNKLIAGVYFDIKNPEKYINRVINEHYKQLK